MCRFQIDAPGELQKKLIVISGCSGGGKSTLLSELNRQGYAVVEEVGRQLVKESNIIPGEAPQLFCELLIEKSVAAYHQAQEMKQIKDQIIFFDRSFLEGISYLQTLNIHQYDHFIHELRFYPMIFVTPPWKEIYVQDAERQHSFAEGVKEHERLLQFYPRCDYQVLEIPKVSVAERVKFILSAIQK